MGSFLPCLMCFLNLSTGEVKIAWCSAGRQRLGELSALCAVGLTRHIRRSSVGRLGQKAAIHNGAPMTPRR